MQHFSLSKKPRDCINFTTWTDSLLCMKGINSLHIIRNGTNNTKRHTNEQLHLFVDEQLTSKKFGKEANIFKSLIQQEEKEFKEKNGNNG